MVTVSLEGPQFLYESIVVDELGESVCEPPERQILYVGATQLEGLSPLREDFNDQIRVFEVALERRLNDLEVDNHVHKNVGARAGWPPSSPRLFGAFAAHASISYRPPCGNRHGAIQFTDTDARLA